VLLAVPEARALVSVAPYNDRFHLGPPCRGTGRTDPATRAGDAIRTLDEHHSRRTSLIERFSELGAKPPQPAGFEPNIFTTIFPMINDHVQLTVTGANCGLPAVGAVRLVLEPKPGLPTDPNNPRLQ
jgi:hypothetical protein